MRIYIKLFIISLFVGFMCVGKFLDWQAERYVDKVYDYDKDGIIKGVKPREYVCKHKKAVVYIHGTFASPESFYDDFNYLKAQNVCDIYLPLLPHEGRRLKEGAKLKANSKELLYYVQTYVQQVAQKYEKVVVVSSSYGSALLLILAREEKLPANVTLVLFCPTVYQKNNTWVKKFILTAYGWWRRYYNAPFINSFLGVAPTNYGKIIYNTAHTKYDVCSVNKAILSLDKKAIKGLEAIKPPFFVVIAKDDNWINVGKLQEKCKENPFCIFYLLPSGKHTFWLDQPSNFTAVLTTHILKENPDTLDAEKFIANNYKDNHGRLDGL